MWCFTKVCNFDCAYCFLPHDERINARIPDIDIETALRTINKTNRTCVVNFTGGETFLVPGFVSLCKALSEKHFIAVASNLSQPAVREFAEQIDPSRVLFILASFHGEELIKHKAYGTFVENYHLLKARGIMIEAVEIAYPPIISQAAHYRDILKKDGIRLIFKPFIGNYAGKSYPADYTDQEISVFRLNKRIFKAFYPQGKFCNAGYNAIAIMPTGEAAPCFDRCYERLGTIKSGISLREDIIRCDMRTCDCTVNQIFPEVYRKALIETRHYYLWSVAMVKHVIDRLLRIIMK
jgi:organic radical activating enzyme